MWLSESRRFAPDGAKIVFSTVVVYKHLAPKWGEAYPRMLLLLHDLQTRFCSS